MRHLNIFENFDEPSEWTKDVFGLESNVRISFCYGDREDCTSDIDHLRNLIEKVFDSHNLDYKHIREDFITADRMFHHWKVGGNFNAWEIRNLFPQRSFLKKNGIDSLDPDKVQILTIGIEGIEEPFDHDECPRILKYGDIIVL